MDYLLYTDGAYFPEHERSAIAYVMLQSEPKKEVRRMNQTVKGETSARAEIKAIISAIYALPQDAHSCNVISDSKYAIDALSRRCVCYSNIDLIALYDKIVKERGVGVTFSWVKSHNGNFYNELCDALCAQAMDEYVSKKQSLT